MIARLAWRNIWRQPVRTSLSLSGMMFTALLLVFMLSFQLGTYETMKLGALGMFDGFGQIQPEGYKEDPDISRLLQDPDALLTALSALPEVTAATPRAMGFVILANGERSFGAAIIGVDPIREPQVAALPGTISQGRYLRAGDSAAIVMGDSLARNLKLSLGDPVTMLGGGLDGSVAADVLTLVGVFDTGVPEVDRQISQMPLTRFQDSFSMGGAVNLIALRGAAFNDIVAAKPDLAALAAQYNARYLDWGALQPAIKQSITLDMSTAMLWYVTLVVVVVFIILNTLYMSVLERTREFGVLLAIGMAPRKIGQMIWMELIFLSWLGSGLGLLAGAALTLYFERVGIAFPGTEEIFAQWGLPPRVYPSLSWLSALAGPVVISLSIAVLGVLPYRRTLSLKPVAAMAAT